MEKKTDKSKITKMWLYNSKVSINDSSLDLYIFSIKTT